MALLIVAMQRQHGKEQQDGDRCGNAGAPFIAFTDDIEEELLDLILLWDGGNLKLQLVRF